MSQEDEADHKHVKHNIMEDVIKWQDKTEQEVEGDCVPTENMTENHIECPDVTEQKITSNKVKNSPLKHRKTKPGPQTFTFQIEKKECEMIKPLNGYNKLKKTWTELFYKRFRRIDPCSTLIFRYHLKPTHSRKKQSPFLKVKASCSFKSCEATYSGGQNY